MKVMRIDGSTLLTLALIGLCFGATGCSFVIDSHNVTEAFEAERTIIGDSTGKIYSRGVIGSGEFVYTAGQIPIDPETGRPFTGDFKQQVRYTLEGLAATLEEAGTSFENVVKVNVYITDLDLYAPLNEVYREYFPEDPPARACVVVKDLVMGVSIEIDMVAVIK